RVACLPLPDDARGAVAGRLATIAAAVGALPAAAPRRKWRLDRRLARCVMAVCSRGGLKLERRVFDTEKGICEEGERPVEAAPAGERAAGAAQARQRFADKARLRIQVELRIGPRRIDRARHRLAEAPEALGPAPAGEGGGELARHRV